jgi:RNA polymerase sigma-B factor
LTPDPEQRSRDTRRLLERYHRDRDAATRAAIVERFLPLASQLARRYAGGSEPIEDLQQVAAVGLLKAIERFEPDHGAAFTSFAVPTILGELKRHFRDRTWFVRVPRDVQELAVRLDKGAAELALEVGRPPTSAELAERLGVSVEDVLEAHEASTAHRAVSLDRPDDPDDEDGGLGDRLGRVDPGFEQAEHAAMVQQLVADLDTRDRAILRMRFEEGLTQSEIGRAIGVSQMHVSRLLRQILARAREAAEGPGPP